MDRGRWTVDTLSSNGRPLSGTLPGSSLNAVRLPKPTSWKPEDHSTAMLKCNCPHAHGERCFALSRAGGLVHSAFSCVGRLPPSRSPAGLAARTRERIVCGSAQSVPYTTGADEKDHCKNGWLLCNKFQTRASLIS